MRITKSGAVNCNKMVLDAVVSLLAAVYSEVVPHMAMAPMSTPLGKLRFVVGELGNQKQDTYGNDAAEGIDGQGVPWDHLDAQPADAEQQGGAENQQKPFF